MGLFSGIKKAFKKVFRGVKKVFKKVWKSPLGKIALVAAAVWTGGAALAAMSTGTGFAGFGTALTGGLAGGTTSALGGYGAALGSVKGALGLGKGAAATTGTSASALTGGSALPGSLAGSSMGGSLAAAPAASSVMAGSSMGGALAANAAQGSTGFLGKALAAGKGAVGWAAKNPLLAGTLIQGVGAAMGAKAEQERYEQELELRGGQRHMNIPVYNPNTGMFELKSPHRPSVA